ncbi:hypothetical protein BGW80DRAFT_1306344 [Lactifluus volemus]|nr:hypothetical protein BGW80DRAFT_1306344 [Lactifluus volemus]
MRVYLHSFLAAMIGYLTCNLLSITARLPRRCCVLPDFGTTLQQGLATQK